MKKEVLIYKGKGTEEELVGRNGYSSAGDLVWSTGGSNVGNFWVQKPEADKKGELLQILSGYHEFISSRRIVNNGDVKAVEEFRLIFKTPNEIAKVITVNLCSNNSNEAQIYALSQAEHLGSSAVNEKTLKFRRGVSFDNWITSINSFRGLEIEDFSFSIYSFVMSRKKSLSGTKITNINPHFFFSDDNRIPNHIKEGGGFALSVVFNSNEGWLSDNGNIMEEVNTTNIGPNEIRNRHQYFVESESYSKSACN